MSDEEEWEYGEDDVGHSAVDIEAHSAQTAHGVAGYEAHRSDEEREHSSDVEPEKTTSKSSRNGGDSKRNNVKKRSRRAAQHESDDDDFESQPSITKWFRQVPGPLQDVMKQQHAIDLQHSMDDDGVMASGRSSGHAVHISTVFDEGPWVDMCDSLGIKTTPGELYGGIKMSSLKHTISYILDDDQSSPKIARLLVLIKSIRYVDEEIVAVFHDPTGEMEGYFHRDIVEQVGPALVNGTGVALRQVSVFTPTDAAVGGTSKRYLNIIPRNVESVFVPTSIFKAVEILLRNFNEGQAEMIEAEAAQKETEEDHSQVQPQRVFAPADVRTATTELSFISQRQVVQRHQPVRLDPSNTTEETNGGATSTGKQKKKKNSKEAPSGLGRWQWQQLAQKKPEANADIDESPNKPRRPMASGRFTELLSQHIQAKSRSTAAPSDRSEAAASVEASTSRTVAATTPSKSSANKSVRFSTINEEEDDDDDW